MQLSIITLTYNHLSYTKKYIESLYKYTDNFELIIVDNGSTDGTVEYLKSLEKNNIKLIFNNENLGFSKGNNQGIEIAEGEYIGFLNNDILLHPNWFEECKKVFENEKNVAFVSPRDVDPHFDITDEKNYIEFYKNNNSYNTEYEKNFDGCVFSCAITKKTVLNDIGIFDAAYTPAFFEDNDLKYRAIMAGYGVYAVNSICFFHFGSVTSIDNNYNFRKNSQYYYNKYPLAEYLSVAARDRDIYRRMCEDFKKFPLNRIYSFYLLIQKFVKKIKKIVRKIFG